MTEPLVSAHNLVKRYGQVTALDDVSLEIDRGSFTVLLGPSGSGKTTMLNILGGFLTPNAGRVAIDGVDVTDVPPAKRPTATVFQDYALFPHMTVGANVGFGLRMRGVPRRERDAKAREMLRVVGLPDVIGRRPHELSGGQRQRVALARALVLRPLVLLLDEPLGALDLKLRRQMGDELKALQKQVGITFVHVTHDQDEAMALADRVVVMNRGRIEDAGAPERVYARPATRFTATFMGEATMIPGRVAESRRGESAVDTALGRLIVDVDLPPGSRVTLGVRPENVATAPTGAEDKALGRARVSEVVFQGSVKRVVATAGPAAEPVRVVFHLPPETTVRPGDDIPIFASRRNLLAFRD